MVPRSLYLALAVGPSHLSARLQFLNPGSSVPNSKLNVSLSPVSCSGKLIEPDEEVVESSDLLFRGLVRSLGDNQTFDLSLKGAVL